MIRNCLANLSLIFFAALAGLGLILGLLFFDSLGAIELPELSLRVPTISSGPAKITIPGSFDLPFGSAQGEAQDAGSKVGAQGLRPPDGDNPGSFDYAQDASSPILQQRNLVEDLPLPPTPTPQPTATPIPPLDPAVYRTEVMIRLKNFAAALEGWLALNDRLAQDGANFDSPDWRGEMAANLEQVRATAQALAAIGPPPPEYAGIHAWFERAAPEAGALADAYTRALDSRDRQDFAAASDSFTRIKEYLAEAVNSMLDAGWPLQ